MGLSTVGDDDENVGFLGFVPNIRLEWWHDDLRYIYICSSDHSRSGHIRCYAVLETWDGIWRVGDDDEKCRFFLLLYIYGLVCGVYYSRSCFKRHGVQIDTSKLGGFGHRDFSFPL